MLDFAALTAEVAQQETVEASAAALMKTLFDEVEKNKTDPPALQAIVDRGRASVAALQSAIVANTPVAPAP